MPSAQLLDFIYVDTPAIAFVETLVKAFLANNTAISITVIFRKQERWFSPHQDFSFKIRLLVQQNI